ncbi:hypothetical protein AQI88_38135 [Streptomyces cellostaticus]|uniref:Uncharacterized protein n=2 Tax=Streptomyces cellostaticus TaxID=67285 RepID=A0A117PTQ1_9ACTN|nr:glycoside hydrolase family 68 protein [Streptomyces cellostaticus]KUM91235.1 hypothetical protein AQI88_38135 [Streptomyces cellostaticus]
MSLPGVGVGTVSRVLNGSDHDLTLLDVATPDQRDRQYRAVAAGDRFDGLLTISLAPTDDEVKELTRAGLPTALLDCEHPDLPRVVIDPGLSGWDGVHGFVGPSLRSDYQPLNGSALVLGNPEDAPTQQYSHDVMPNGLVESFIDTVPAGDGGTRFGGTLARTLVLSPRGNRTRHTNQLDYGFIP